jgi:hypothetical protein
MMALFEQKNETLTYAYSTRIKRRMLYSFGIVLILTVYLLHQKFYHTTKTYLSSPSPNYETASSIDSIAWSHLPSIAVMTRSYSGMFEEILHFMFTFQIFWPRAYTKTRVVWIFDAENSLDHMLGTLLLQTAPYIDIAFESLPGDGILSSAWRNLGYCRQQYSNFYSDKYTNAMYVAIMDSDAFFVRPINPDDIFDVKTGLPIIVGYNAQSSWCASADFLIGKKCIGEFMINFPVVIKTSHFEDMRRHIISHMNVSSFEEAFRRMLDLYERGAYSQFNIMATYLWYYKHNEYTWHINSCGPQCRHTSRSIYQWPVPDKTQSEALQMQSRKVFQYNIPVARYAKHSWGGTNFTPYLQFLYESLCVSSSNKAGECMEHVENRNNREKNVYRNWYTDYLTSIPNEELPWTTTAYPNFMLNGEKVVNKTRVVYSKGFRSLETKQVTFTPLQVRVINRAFVYP